MIVSPKEQMNVVANRARIEMNHIQDLAFRYAAGDSSVSLQDIQTRLGLFPVRYLTPLEAELASLETRGYT